MALALLRAARCAVRRAAADRPPAAGPAARPVGRSGRPSTCVGAALLGLSLAGIVLAFATADPEVQVFSPAGPWLLAGSAVFAAPVRLAAAHAPRSRWSRPVRSRATAAWGSLLVSFFVGAALIAALVDIPVFARVTVYPDSQLGAALVLVRLLAALPVGAVARRLPPTPGARRAAGRGRDGAGGASASA